MGVLEQVINMRRQGISEGDIIDNLSQQGISPKEITNALRQAQIKNAVSEMDTGDMQQSMQEVPAPNEQTYTPADYDETPSQEYQPQQQYQPPQYSQEQYQQGDYGQQYAQPGGIDTDTVMEVAGQVFSEKIKKTQKLVDATSEAAITLQSKFENISERLKKVENIIDKLQIAILEKVGSYGQNLESVKKEMSMMQDSFSKMISSKREREPTEHPAHIEHHNTEHHEKPKHKK